LSSRFIPRDQLAAVLPWRLAALAPGRIQRKNGLIDEAAEAATASSAVNQARDEGFRHGLEVGFAKGLAVGESNAQQHDQQFGALAAGLQNAVAGIDETVANELLELALELARQVVRTHLEVRRDAIVPVIHEALNSVIAMARHPCLVMHPIDAEIVQREMADEIKAHNCRIAADERMARGGVRIDDASFELDATLPTRWARTLATLGLQDDWLV
jgi:flagellar assembly protein FliH